MNDLHGSSYYLLASRYSYSNPYREGSIVSGLNKVTAWTPSLMTDTKKLSRSPCHLLIRCHYSVFLFILIF